MRAHSKRPFWYLSVAAWLLVLPVAGAGGLFAQDVPKAPRGFDQPGRTFVGELNSVADDDLPRPVRNDVAQAADEIVTLRYWRIKKGSFDEFYKASVEGVWPYFEKLGARVIGMWQVFEPPGVPDAIADNKEYDEVYLATRYAGVEHWKATRDTVRHGGNGPDWQACRKALAVRRGLTLATHVRFLKGHLATNGPFFMPGLDESYQPRP